MNVLTSDVKMHNETKKKHATHCVFILAWFDVHINSYCHFYPLCVLARKYEKEGCVVEYKVCWKIKPKNIIPFLLLYQTQICLNQSLFGQEQF